MARRILGVASASVFHQDLSGHLNSVSSRISASIDHFSTMDADSGQILRPYLTVNHAFVRGKLRQLLFPFTIHNWNRDPLSTESGLPTHSPNQVDLYVPIVFTFIFHFLSLIFLGASEQFTMVTFSSHFFKWAAALVSEFLLTKIIFKAVNIRPPLPILTLIADLGNISVYLSLATLFCLNSTARLVVLFYFAFCSFFWTLRTLSPKEGLQPVHPSAAQIYSLLAIALVHSALPFVLVLNLADGRPVGRGVEGAKWTFDGFHFLK
jgi:hypothetical protein